jgi:hypothetical protein
VRGAYAAYRTHKGDQPMYMRIGTATWDSAQEENMLCIIDKVVIPLFKQQPGFVSYVMGVNRSQKRSTSVLIWESEEHFTAALPTLTGIAQQFEAAGMHFLTAEFYELLRRVQNNNQIV